MGPLLAPWLMMGAIGQPPPDPAPEIPPEVTLEQLAAGLVAAELASEALRKLLLDRMTIGAMKRLDVPGRGHVVLVEAATTTPIDAKGCAAKIGVLAGRLRALGVKDVDDGIPMSVVSRRAGLRVNLRVA
jgi:hypothetical protein